ncbi:hypothetical protein Y032_0137g2032 [Ancylostoma ceylanicum]|uniref:Uncharacterized protein n=1 Tax=Ancylostoma ceylanicum TaxID=53326 RepID=A0A016T492_9BILA|nr:hypothetical protein Y032_0137g2032 [Ancylostoma ceylanicum]
MMTGKIGTVQGNREKEQRTSIQMKAISSPHLQGECNIEPLKNQGANNKTLDNNGQIRLVEWGQTQRIIPSCFASCACMADSVDKSQWKLNFSVPSKLHNTQNGDCSNKRNLTSSRHENNYYVYK